MAISFLLLGLTVFTFASIGGDKNKSKGNSLHPGFTPIRTASGFSLRNDVSYRGSLILKQDRTAAFMTYSSLVTYQKGNATYILPNKFKVPLNSELKSNLQTLQLKIKLCR